MPGWVCLTDKKSSPYKTQLKNCQIKLPVKTELIRACAVFKRLKVFMEKTMKENWTAINDRGRLGDDAAQSHKRDRGGSWCFDAVLPKLNEGMTSISMQQWVETSK